ncbi:hypothetical protein RHABOEDO_001383 [Candidatus Rhabdochlamydia oedothoracis]|uniref:Uncharacterized protein n=1 Tax=Candidatus Rhabdochlamydia oedothoracis TaxID=2720720 RepID=A0ABX8V1L4_9BACT|nr:hypothetical protein [Candidatus Rhabdochlamydia oedothoracis]QYF49113.1 hypothetical protein RHABOEDO_001383 [Candidatus Rhabdochlamydia oedothoracis]
MKKLIPSQIADLEHKLKHPKDYSERNRLCVILGYDEGILICIQIKSLSV